MSVQMIKKRLSTDRKQPGVVSLIILMGVFASVLMYWITDQGSGVSPDSITYIEAARSLLEGKGFFVHGAAMIHYPPVFPLLLGVVGLFTHGDILLAARWLAALLFGVNLLLVGLAVQVSTKHSLGATGCAILVFLFSAPAISVHSMTWSEPPYITFSMAGLLLAAHHVVRPSPSLLVLASLMVGLAAATRYVGVVLFPSVALAIFLLGKRSLKHRMTDILVLSGVACLPLIFWFLRNMLVAQSATNREFAFHPFNLYHAQSLINHMYDFVLPISISGWAKAVHVGVTATLFVLAYALLYRKMCIKQSAMSISIVIPSIFVIYSVLYVAFLVVSISLFDAHTPVDHRLLLPVFLTLAIAGTSVAKSLSEALTQRCVWYGFVFLVLISVSIGAGQAISRAVDIHYNGSGYTSRDWKDSATLAYLADVPGIMKIYSNGPDVIRFLTGKKAYMIPAKVSAQTLKENEGYLGQLNQMFRECKEGNALIAYLNSITQRWYLPSKEEIESMFSIPIVVRLEDGVIYRMSVVKSKAEQGAALDEDSAALHPG